MVPRSAARFPQAGATDQVTGRSWPTRGRCRACRSPGRRPPNGSRGRPTGRAVVQRVARPTNGPSPSGSMDTSATGAAAEAAAVSRSKTARLAALFSGPRYCHITEGHMTVQCPAREAIPASQVAASARSAATRSAAARWTHRAGVPAVRVGPARCSRSVSGGPPWTAGPATAGRSRSDRPPARSSGAATRPALGQPDRRPGRTAGVRVIGRRHPDRVGAQIQSGAGPDPGQLHRQARVGEQVRSAPANAAERPTPFVCEGACRATVSSSRCSAQVPANAAHRPSTSPSSAARHPATRPVR